MSKLAKDRTLASVKKKHIFKMLRRNHYNVTSTAEELGISLRALRYLLRGYEREDDMPYRSYSDQNFLIKRSP